VRLRPAIAPGEDRNLDRHDEFAAWKLRLRPAIAPGEDRNLDRHDEFAAWKLRLRPAIAPGEDRNRTSPVEPLITGHRCARPSRRARIATTDR